MMMQSYRLIGDEYMHGKVTNEEWEIFKEAYHFFSAHSEPPANQSDEAVAWWMQTAKDVVTVDSKWKEYPLMRSLLLGIYEYLEYKSKEKTKEADEFVPEL